MRSSGSSSEELGRDHEEDGEALVSWWVRVLAKILPMRSERLASVGLTLPGWEAAPRQGDMWCWRDPAGDLLTLTHARGHLGPTSDEAVSWQRRCREMAEGSGGGLIEATIAMVAGHRVGSCIHKRLRSLAYVYTGTCMVPAGRSTFVWTVVASERGTTGVREAVVTTDLFNTGQLTIAQYEQSWAADPYDPAYRGVDRTVLRFMSDDPRYDEQFPEHPLLKIRRLLPLLPAQISEDVWRTDVHLHSKGDERLEQDADGSWSVAWPMSRGSFVLRAPEADVTWLLSTRSSAAAGNSHGQPIASHRLGVGERVTFGRRPA
jgi:hypothetical protein